LPLTPDHQLLTAKARISAQYNPYIGPRLAQLLYNPRYLFHRAFRTVDVRGSQLRTEQVFSTENVEWQVAVFVVVAVEEPAFLLAVERVVRGGQDF
jgi:hypothetical protein